MMGKKREIKKTGYETIQYAIKKLLEETEGYEFHLTPKTFGYYMKEIPLNTPKNNLLTPLEKKKFKKQLKKVKKFWSGENWKVRESGGKKFKLIFERIDR